MIDHARHSLADEIEGRLDREGATDASLQAVLERVLKHFDCAVGTIHDLDQQGLLRLRAQRGIPQHLLERVRSFPIGKGMAGLAAERRQPVQVCNLQTDTSGVARPAAKETHMEGSIAIPILVADSLRGTLGVAKPVPHEFSEAETALLQEVANAIGKHFGP